MVAKEGLVDGPGLGERGSGMYHLHRGEQTERSGTWCILNTQHKHQGLFWDQKASFMGHWKKQDMECIDLNWEPANEQMCH